MKVTKGALVVMKGEKVFTPTREDETVKFVVHGREKAKMSFWSKHYKGKIIMDGRE